MDAPNTPEEKTAYAQQYYEKQKYGPLLAGNRHERRKAIKLMRQASKKV